MKIKIELEIEGEKRIFVAPVLKGRIYREVFKMHRLLNEGISEETLDTLVSFVADDVFKKQFTVDEYYDGISASKCLGELMRVLSDIMQMIQSGVEQDTQQ